MRNWDIKGGAMTDRFEDARKALGADKVDTFLSKFGLGPKYVPKEPKKTNCPKCNKGNAFYKEIHPDTAMNDIVLYCPDCNFLDE
jgi:hypothetical protein